MEDILHQLIGSLSHYLPGFYTSQVVVWDFWTINSMGQQKKSWPNQAGAPDRKVVSMIAGSVCATEQIKGGHVYL